MTELERYEDSEGRTHIAFKRDAPAEGSCMGVSICDRCEGLVVRLKKLVDAYGYPDTGFYYFGNRSSHDCNVRLNRGLGPRTETK